MKQLIILVACEESQAVCIALRERGHLAFSCDILPCSGGHPEWHIQEDVLRVVKGGSFTTQYGQSIAFDCWDMMIAFPPCTHLALSGAKHFEKKRADGRQRQGIEFFMSIYNAPIEKIAIENPMGIMSGGEYLNKWYPDLVEKYGLPIKYSQVIQPYYFGDEAQKTTCLWLKNLPPLYHNAEPNLFDQNITHVDKGEFITFESGKRMAKWYAQLRVDEQRGGIRSKTFPGIATAMADTWGGCVNPECLAKL